MPHLAFPTPLGDITLVEESGSLVALDWGRQGPDAETSLLRRARDQIDAYFAGRRTQFDLPLAPPGTRFQHSVWAAMREIPYGQTLSYGALAHRLDSGPRAVGGACGKNPLPLLIPCHRVLAAGGRLGGYTGHQGLDTKRFLLRLEGAL